jgi:hypothetical protein
MNPWMVNATMAATTPLSLKQNVRMSLENLSPGRSVNTVGIASGRLIDVCECADRKLLNVIGANKMRGRV